MNYAPSPIDDRDYIFSAEYYALPLKVDLRPYADEIENQSYTNSCVANAVVSALELLSLKHGRHNNLSRLFLYYNLRESYPNLNGIDGGSYLRDGFKIPSKFGICSEDVWGFIPANVNIKPDNTSYTEALRHKVTRYERIFLSTNPITRVKIALAQGYPVVFGTPLGRTFYHLNGPLSTHNYVGVNHDMGGYHAMCIVGYDDDLGGLIVENSWGPGWGDNGYCLIKYDVFIKDCMEAWVCTGFDGINYAPDWIDTSPDLVLENQIVTVVNHKKDGLIFNGAFKIKSGTPPYTYEWSLYEGEGTFVAKQDSPEIIFTKTGGKIDPAVRCIITESGPLKKKAIGYIVFKYIDTLILTGRNILKSILISTNLELNGLVTASLSAKLQQMIDNNTYSSLAAAIVMSGFSTDIRGNTDITTLYNLITVNSKLIEESVNFDDINFPIIEKL